MKTFITLCLTLFALGAQANVLGDLQTFAPNTDGLDFITVHTSRPLTEGYFAVGGHFSFARDHFRVYRSLATQERENYHDRLGEFDFDIAYGITNRLSAFFSVPNLIYYQPDGGQEYIAGASKGAHTYRPGFKWNLGPKSFDFAVVGSVDIPNVTNNPYTGTPARPIYNFELAKSFTAPQKVVYGLNLGYRLREPGDRPSDARMFPLDDQFTFSVARSGPFTQKSRWIVEGIFSVPAQKGPYKRAMDESSADILIGLKHRLMRNLNFDWGGTFEPFVDTMSPHYRVFAGLVYYFNPGWFSKESTPAPPPPAPTIEADVKDDSTVSVRQDFEVPPLEIEPEFAEVFEGSTVTVQARGGVLPYKFRLISGHGRMRTSEVVTYRTALVSETSEIEISDQSHQIKVAHIVTKAAPKEDQLIRIKKLNFIFNTSTLVKSSKAEIQRIVRVLSPKKIRQIIVEGHTDWIGSEEYNLTLSQERAEAVREILIHELHLEKGQVIAIGFGKARPIATNTTVAGRLANRRVDLKVYFNK